MKAHFEENSSMSYLLLMAAGLAIVFGVVSVILYQNGTMLSFYIMLVLGVVFSALLFYLGNVKLVVKMDGQGVQYAFSPFVKGEQKLAWNDIQSAQVVKYKPLFDFGGWGARYSTKNGAAYSTRGDIGLQLVLKDGKKLLLTVIDEARAKETLAALGK